MMHKTGFYQVYTDLVHRALAEGVFDSNERTGHGVFVIRGGASFTLDLRCGKLPVPGTRRVFPKSAAAEIAWMLMGTKDPSFINKYAPLWAQFTEADGTIPAAYGYRWREHFGRDQLARAVQRLGRNPSDRQVVVMAWDPASDALGSTVLKNVPCPLGFSLHSLPTGDGGREVCGSVYVRSSDLFVGLPYDVMGYALLLKAVQCQLNEDEKAPLTEDAGRPPRDWQMGTLQFTLSHPHLYEDHVDSAEEMLASAHLIDEPELPEDWPIAKIIAGPHRYVDAVSGLTAYMGQPVFHVRPKVVL